MTASHGAGSRQFAACLEDVPDAIIGVDPCSITPRCQGAGPQCGRRSPPGDKTLGCASVQHLKRRCSVSDSCVYVASASIKAFRFSAAVSKCFRVKRTITGSASLKKPRLSPR
jgi:hypothetical protein